MNKYFVSISSRILLANVARCQMLLDNILLTENDPFSHTTEA